jgi:hypothetical protein
MKKELMIMVIVVALLTSVFVFAKPIKDPDIIKANGNVAFVAIVGDNTDDYEITGYVQYHKKGCCLHTTWQIDGLEPNTEYQLKLHCKGIDGRLYVGPQWDDGILLWGNWGGESFLVMEIVESDDMGHIGYGFDECRLVLGNYKDIQFIITENKVDAPWPSAWTWENSPDSDDDETGFPDTMDFDSDIHTWEIKHADLILVKKDPDGPDDIMGTADDWSPVWDSYGVLIYNKAGPTFNYEFYGANLQISTGYSLIYYADPWPGNNPGALIDTGTSDSSGNLHIPSGTVELTMHLPHEDDANYPTGAKSDYNSGTKSMQSWNPTDYLYEWELITYFDTDLP